jgi:homoserine O-acetyltransferase
MTQNPFASSDAARAAGELAHARSVTFDEPLPLERDGALEEVTVVYETYGQLNEARDNAILICHALTGDSHVARHDPDDEPGWWDLVEMVGPGCPIDTDRYFVICPNVLGGCRGTTGPNSTHPATGKPYGQEFPTVTVRDMVNLQLRLVDHLGIERLLAVVGGSMGGHQVLQWGVEHSQRVKGCVALATSPRLTSQSLAFDVVGRNAIMHDPNYRDGQYYDGGEIPRVGLAIARMLGHITYLSREAMAEKFDATRTQPRDIQTGFEKHFSVGTYLAHQGSKFVERFDANSYITLSMAMDLFDLGDTPAELERTFDPSQCSWLVVSFTSDWLFPPEQSQEIVQALIRTDAPVSYCNVSSSCGHDAFLLPDNFEAYGPLVGAYLANLAGSAPDRPGDLPDMTRSSRVVHAGREDYERICRLIPPQATVLDLGCGSGGLMLALRRRAHATRVGLEVQQDRVIECVQRGLYCIQADLNEGLRVFTDGQFDYVVLSLTLQAVYDVRGVLAEMVRVGRRGVVTFPNFAYKGLREMLCGEGKAPVAAGGILGHQWYDTPNIRFLSLTDFEALCDEMGLTIHDRVALNTFDGVRVDDEPNLHADLGIYVISA